MLLYIQIMHFIELKGGNCTCQVSGMLFYSMTEQRKSLSNTSEATVEIKCILCRRYGHSMSSPLQWKMEDAHRYVVGLIPSGGKVCQACRKDVSRLLSDSNFVPRWSKLKTEKYCSINNCDNSVFASIKSGR